mgnify:CR=1 FL=1
MQGNVALIKAETTKEKMEIMETANNNRMTASEKRFAQEMQVIMRMSLSELLTVEKNRMPIGV